MNQLAITKTPPRHGTYCVRLKLADGATLEFISARAMTFDELIDELEKRIADLRRFEAVEKDGAA